MVAHTCTFGGGEVDQTTPTVSTISLLVGGKSDAYHILCDFLEKVVSCYTLHPSSNLLSCSYYDIIYDVIMRKLRASINLLVYPKIP